MSLTELAEIAYNAYCASTGGISLRQGFKLPEFKALPEAIKVAWISAAIAVKDTKWT